MGQTLISPVTTGRQLYDTSLVHGSSVARALGRKPRGRWFDSILWSVMFSYNWFHVRILLFADDCALFAHNADDLQRLTTSFASKASAFGLEINVSKTFSFYQPSSGDSTSMPPNILINNNSIATCGNVCYLGSHLTTDQSVDRELSARVSKASYAFGCL